MPRFAANLSMLFTEVPFLERFERAANAGFEAVEFLFPYAHTVEEIKERLDATGLKIVLHNLPAGDWDAGERGIACDPKRVDEFRAGIEPINPFDIPGFYLNRTDEALSILDEVGAPNAFVQYDIYHAQRVEGELAATMQKQLGRIGHIQLADNPGRNEPGTGEINYPFLFAHLDRIGYDGWIGCEYKPANGTESGLGWLQKIGGWSKVAVAA